MFIGSILFFVLAIIIQVIPAHADFNTIDPTSLLTIDPSVFQPGADGQLLTVRGGKLRLVNDSYTSSSPYLNMNLGAYASYPNPSGMINTYLESTTSQPILGVSAMGSTTNYMQGLFVQNLARGGNASGDIVIADDKGSATSSDHYLDLGIANTGQSDGSHTAILPYDSYLYNEGTTTPTGIILSAQRSSIILSAGMQLSSPSIRIDKNAHIFTKGTAPTLSGCGTSPTVNGNDNAGAISLGAGLSVTACTVTFAATYPTVPVCTVSSGSTLAAASVSAVSQTAFSASLTLSLGGGKLYYQCQGIDN